MKCAGIVTGFVLAVASSQAIAAGSTIQSTTGLPKDAYESTRPFFSSLAYDKCDDWVFPDADGVSVTRKNTCGIRIAVSKIAQDATTKTYVCTVDYPKPLRMQKAHRRVIWHLDVDPSLKGWSVGFPEFRSMPAVGFYDSFYFSDWERRGELNFVWKAKRKHPKDMGSNYFVMIKFIDPSDSAKLVRFCEIKDPIITNDSLIDDDPGDS